MSKWPFFLSFVYSSCCFGNEGKITNIFDLLSSPTYQDIVIHNHVIKKGTNACDARYQVIKPIFDLYQTSFSVLDLGAAQGYFSFRIANEYPHAHCIMIEENSADYLHHGDLLYELCLLNQMNNITYLRKRLNYNDLCFLNHQEHFNVVLAFLVVHQMATKHSDQQMYFERIFKLGDNVIVEVANDVAIELTQFIESLARHSDCEYLGEVPRFQNSTNRKRGRLYWFKNPKATKRQGISKNTLRVLNGVFPLNASLQ